MDTTAFLVNRQDIVTRLEGRRLVKIEKPRVDWLYMIKLAFWPMASFFWLKKAKRQPFDFTKVLASPLSGSLLTAALAAIKLMR